MDSSSEDVFTELRMKYAEEIEETLECPICFELPQGSIAQCIQGHNICASCKEVLESTGNKCPICQCSFGSTRNYTAEKLCAIFEDIKSSVLDPRHASNRRVNKKSIEVQTMCNCTCTCTGSEENSLNSNTEMIGSKKKKPKIESTDSSKQNNNLKKK